jgi:ubiquinone/menaquinone biosynthesis C-methylase UbiE
LTTLAGAYDALILHPELRRYFGPRGYYNAGWWEDGCTSQEEACDALVSRVASLASPASRHNVLDVGCGLGSSTRALASCWPHAQITGVNFSLRQIAEARRGGGRFLAGDAVRLPMRDASVDCLVSIEAAFHFATRAGFFGEAARVLVDGGILLMTDILFTSSTFPGSETVPAANHLHDLDEYRDQLARCPFTSIAIDDITSSTWAPFTRSLHRWASAEQPTWVPMAEALERNTASHYLLLSAKRADR